VRDDGAAFVMQFVARDANGYATYVIAERALWRGE
jgi:hypothetical protein